MHQLSNEAWGLSQLRGKRLEAEVLRRKWFAQENDLIGGWCVMPVNEPPSGGFFAVADFVSEKIARYIAALHNAEIGQGLCVMDADIPTAGHTVACMMSSCLTKKESRNVVPAQA